MRIYCFGINLIFTSVIISAGMVVVGRSTSCLETWKETAKRKTRFTRSTPSCTVSATTDGRKADRARPRVSSTDAQEARVSFLRQDVSLKALGNFYIVDQLSLVLDSQSTAV